MNIYLCIASDGLKCGNMENYENTNSSNSKEFVSLLAANQRKLFAYIMSLVVNINDADDIMQETVQEMLKRFDRFELGTDFLAWATTIAYYRVLDFRKHKKGEKLIFNDEIFDRLQNQAKTELQDMDDYLVYLRQCMQKLAKTDLGLVNLKYVNGMAVKEIASRFGRTKQSVYRSIARIQDLLRHCIKKRLSAEGLK